MHNNNNFIVNGIQKEKLFHKLVTYTIVTTKKPKINMEML